MTGPSLYPLRFEPMFQYRLWGGRGLGEWMGQALPGDDPIGEAWILSDRADHSSRVSNGALKGTTLSELMASAREALLGPRSAAHDRFPLLLKFLDVREMLSVQVHPRDDQSDLIPAGDTGKSEAWVVLEAEPAARVYAGLKPGATQADLRALSKATVDDRLASFTPRVGQGVMITAGTVHSLGDGVMVFEVQENSDVTFRLYDWEHVDAKTGHPRALQVDQALACIDLAQGPVLPVRPAVEETAPIVRELLFDDPHFTLWRRRGGAAFDVGAEGEARILVCVDGEGALEHAGQDWPVDRGAVMLLPAALGVCVFQPNETVTLLEIAMPDRP